LFVLGEYIRSYNETYDEYLYTCKGKINYSDFSLKCSNGKAHGKLDLSEVFAKSCNCSFADIGLKTDTDSLKAYCNNKLFNSNLPLEIPYSKSSYVLNVNNSEFMKIQTYIGQGETLVTPIHMCMVMSSIVNDGMLMKPRLVTELIDANDNIVKKIDASEYKKLYTSDEASNLKTYLREVVTSGTAYRLNDENKYIYGKTGTAQISTAGKADSWFVGGIELNDGSKYSIAVVIENIDDNTSPAIVVTKEIIKSLDK
jgi:peptidoglycan glycosyltransferase